MELNLHTSDTALIFREVPEMSHKISSKTYSFLPKFWNLPHPNEEVSYIFYAFLKNLPEMKGKSPWCPFETYHMYAFTFIDCKKSCDQMNAWAGIHY